MHTSAPRTGFTALGLMGLVGLVAACAPDGPAEVDEVIEGVEYYYACPDEPLSLPDGRVFYPIHDDPDFDESKYNALIGPGIATVNPPGPGDDEGTLTIYTDGVAHWESDSGIEAWLDDNEREFNWVC